MKNKYNIINELKIGDKVKFNFEIFDSYDIIDYEGCIQPSSDIFDIEFMLLMDIFDNNVYEVEWFEIKKTSIGISIQEVKVKGLSKLYSSNLFELVNEDS